MQLVLITVLALRTLSWVRRLTRVARDYQTTSMCKFLATANSTQARFTVDRASPTALCRERVGRQAKRLVSGPPGPPSQRSMYETHTGRQRIIDRYSIF